MNKKLFLLALNLLLLCFSANWAVAQEDWSINRQQVLSADTITRNGYTLEFVNNDTDLNPTLKQKMIEAFFTVYPAEAATFNPGTSKNVIFFMDTQYLAIAATSGDIVRFNPQWFKKSPGDIDVVTHEVMHIVQSYGDDAGPWWVTEGIADYARYVFGVDNAGANWSLTPFSRGQHYDNGYRVTARFLAWIDKNKMKGFVQKLDAAMRNKTYTPGIWKQSTQKTLDQLWSEYSKNSDL